MTDGSTDVDAPHIAVRRLRIQPLEATAFASFGTIVGPESADSPSLNRASGNLGLLWVHAPLQFPKQAYLCTLRYYYRGLRCEFVQKHPESTIVLIPVGGRASAIVVVPDTVSGKPDLEQAAAFLLDGTRGVILKPGVWVRYAYPIGDFADFTYITQRVDPATANTIDDVVRVRLDEEMGFVFELEFEVPNGPAFERGPSGALVSAPPRNPPWQ